MQKVTSEWEYIIQSNIAVLVQYAMYPHGADLDSVYKLQQYIPHDLLRYAF